MLNIALSTFQTTQVRSRCPPQIRKKRFYYQKIEIVVVAAAAVIVAVVVVYLLGGEGDEAHDTPVLVHGVACVQLLDQYNLWQPGK